MASKPRTPDPAPRPGKRGRRRNDRKDGAVVQGLVGVGLDGTDGHTRITRGPRFYLLGGSKDTHDHMQEFVIRLDERLGKKGKPFGVVTPDELRDIASELE